MSDVFGRFRPAAPESRGPGDYVKEKYDAAFGSAVESAGRSSLSFFASSFGKGVLTAGLVVLAAGAILGASAAIPVVGSLGLVTTAAPLQAAMIGLAEAGSFLFSGAGLLTMAVGGLLGIAVEKSRTPEMSVEQAKALAAQYKQNREAGLEQQQQLETGIQASTQEPATVQAPITVAAPEPQAQAKPLAQEPKGTATRTPEAAMEGSFLARENERRALNAQRECQVG